MMGITRSKVILVSFFLCVLFSFLFFLFLFFFFIASHVSNIGKGIQLAWVAPQIGQQNRLEHKHQIDAHRLFIQKDAFKLCCRTSGTKPDACKWRLVASKLFCRTAVPNRMLSSYVAKERAVPNRMLSSCVAKGVVPNQMLSSCVAKVAVPNWMLAHQT